MRKIFAFFVVFSLFSAAFADNIDGYFKLKFGMNESEVRGIVKEMGFDFKEKQAILNDIMMFEYVPYEDFTVFFENVFNIQCAFYSDKLISIQISFLDVNDINELIKYITNRYDSLDLYSKNIEKNEFKLIDTKTLNYLKVNLKEYDDSKVCCLLSFMSSKKNVDPYIE